MQKLSIHVSDSFVLFGVGQSQTKKEQFWKNYYMILIFIQKNCWILMKQKFETAMLTDSLANWDEQVGINSPKDKWRRNESVALSANQVCVIEGLAG